MWGGIKVSFGGGRDYFTSSKVRLVNKKKSGLLAGGGGIKLFSGVGRLFHFFKSQAS